MKSLLIGLVLCTLSVCGRAQSCQLSYEQTAKRITLNDSVTLAYVEQGQGKQTLLMIHGLGGNLSHWQRNVLEPYRCIALDLPSYGLSSRRAYQPPSDMLGFYADIIEAFIKQKKLRNVVLMGHSMGGQVAVLVALKQLKAVKQLVLVAPAGFETFTPAEAASLLSFAKPETFKNQNEALVRASFKRNFVEMPSQAEALIQDRLMLAQCPTYEPYFKAVAAGVKGMLDRPVRADLGKISLPTLVIFGENDDLIPNKILHKSLTTAQVAAVASEMPRAQWQLIPKAGHMVMYERPEAFNRLVEAFVKKPKP